MLIFTHTLTHTLTHKHNAFLHNSPANNENGLGREQEKHSVNFHPYRLTQKHDAFLCNSPAKVENGLGRDPGKAVFISTHT